MLKNIDKKQKIELTITAIGIVFLISLFLTNISKPKKAGREPSMVQVPPAASSILPVASVDRHVSTAKWGKDPFYPETPFGGINPNVSGFILNGIAWDAENPYVIINDEIAKVGDKISGMTVIEINEKSVVIEQDGQKHTLELNIY